MLIPSIPAVLVIPRLSIVTTSKPAFTSAGTWYVFHTRPGLPAPHDQQYTRAGAGDDVVDGDVVEGEGSAWVLFP